MKNEKKSIRETKKSGIRIVNKKSGIAVASLLGLFVVALVVLSVGPILRPLDTPDNFQMDEITLNNAHNSNNLMMHNHVTLEVSIQGSKTLVPATIGIDSTLHRDHSLDTFGIRDPSMAPMHTHESDGVIHIESTTLRDYTLGEFLDIWGINFEGKTTSLTVDGVAVPDYRSHILLDGQRLFLEAS